MNEHFLSGFYKEAQMSPEETIAPPEEQNKETTVTCLSGCQYAQNPEKRCMLESVSFSQDENGVFVCGQFVPMMAPDSGVMPGAQASPVNGTTNPELSKPQGQ